MPLYYSLSGLWDHVLPMLSFWCSRTVFTYLNNIKTYIYWLIKSLHWAQFQSLFLPANNIRPINSFLPMLSKSITITSKEHSLIFSQGTLKLKDSLNTGFNVHVNIGVFLFSTLLSPNWSQTFTYGSKDIIKWKNIKTMLYLIIVIDFFIFVSGS